MIIAKYIVPIYELFDERYYMKHLKDKVNVTELHLTVKRAHAGYCKLFADEHRCNFVVQKKIELKSSCEHITGDTNVTYTGEVNRDYQPHGRGWSSGLGVGNWTNGCPSEL